MQSTIYGQFSPSVDTLEVLRADLLVIWGTAGETRLPRLPAAIVRRLFVATRYLPNVYLQELAARCIQRIYAMGVSARLVCTSSDRIFNTHFLCSSMDGSLR